MANPELQVLIDWRAEGLNRITNSGIETNTTGWGIGGGSIAGAATSITRITSDSYIGAASASLVTDAVSGSGAAWDLTGTFTSARTYRATVALKRTSGTTSGRIVFGSVGTVGDRAVTTMTLTTGWVVYSVDWTPSANRTDAAFGVTTGAASILTVKFDAAEVYEAINDVTGDVDNGITWKSGANFDGSTDTPGTCNLTLWNVGLTGGTYSPTDAASPFENQVRPGRKVWIRTTYEGVVKGQFYGYIRRVIPRAMEMKVELFCEDPMSVLAATDYSASVDHDDTYAAFRSRILADAGLSSAVVYTAGPEDGTFHSFTDKKDSLSILTEVNIATRSLHYFRAGASSDAPYAYVVVDRADQIDDGIIAEHYDDDFSDLADYDLTDELLINVQRVQPHLITPDGAYENKLTYVSTPIAMAANDEVSLWITYKKTQAGTPVYGGGPSGAVFTVTAAGATKTYTYRPQSVSCEVVNGGSAGQIHPIQLSARWYKETPSDHRKIEDAASIATYGRHRGQPIDSLFIQTSLKAKAIAQYIIDRYSEPRASPTLVVENRFPSQLERDIGERVTIDFARLGLVAEAFVIRTLETTAHDRTHWETKYTLEEIP